MSTSPRTVALLGGGGLLIAGLAFLGGRRSAPEGEPTNALVLDASRPQILQVPVPSSSNGSTGSDAGAAPQPLGAPSSAADLFTRLQSERDTRPKLEPTADSVFAAMKAKLDVQVDEELQVAGFVVGARYCNKVRTKKDVHVVVCEYSDEPSAIKGLAFGDNAAIKGREVLRNKTTTCAVFAADEKRGAAEAVKIKSLFKSM